MDQRTLEDLVLPYFRNLSADERLHLAVPTEAQVGSYIRSSLRRVNAVCARVSQQVPTEGRLLEAGAGYGLITLALGTMGYRVLATELPDTIKARCGALTSAGVTVEAWDLHTQDAPQNGFDAVIASEVIEHLQVNPAGAMRRLLQAVRPGGLLLVTAPNLYCFDNLGRVLKGRNINEPFPSEPDMKDGIVVDARMHPREPTLVELCEAAKVNHLSVLEASYFEAATGTGWLRGVVSKLIPATRDSLLLVGRKPEH